MRECGSSGAVLRVLKRHEIAERLEIFRRRAGGDFAAGHDEMGVAQVAVTGCNRSAYRFRCAAEHLAYGINPARDRHPGAYAPARESGIDHVIQIENVDRQIGDVAADVEFHKRTGRVNGVEKLPLQRPHEFAVDIRRKLAADCVADSDRIRALGRLGPGEADRCSRASPHEFRRCFGLHENVHQKMIQVLAVSTLVTRMAASSQTRRVSARLAIFPGRVNSVRLAE